MLLAACTSHQAFGLATESPESSIKGQRISSSWAGLGWPVRHCCQTIADKKEVACLRSAARQKFYPVNQCPHADGDEDEGKKVRSLSNIPLCWPVSACLRLCPIPDRPQRLPILIPCMCHNYPAPPPSTSPRTIHRNKPPPTPPPPPLIPGYPRKPATPRWIGFAIQKASSQEGTACGLHPFL